MGESHAALRAWERYGIELKEHEIADCARTAHTDGVLVAKQADGTSIWMVKIKGVVCLVVLSKSKNIITFLPKGAKLNRDRM